MDFDEALRTRRSVRHFSDEEVPREVVASLIEQASWAPSAGNRQPWRVAAMAPSAARPLIDRLEPRTWEILYPTLREVFEKNPALLGEESLSGRELTDATFAAVEREIFLRGAPWLLVVHFPRPKLLEWCKRLGSAVGLAPHRLLAQGSLRERAELALFLGGHVRRAIDNDFIVDVGSVAGFMYALSLAATARGVHSCIQYSWALVADEVKAALGLPAEDVILGAVALGWPDATESDLSRRAAPRRPVPVTWHD